MKIFTVSEAAPKVFSRGGKLLKKFGISVESLAKIDHPPEDFLAVSKRYPIFAVADGVTLELDKHSHYPKKSGAAAVAKIFCETAVAAAEKNYGNFSTLNLKTIFSKVNAAVGRYNRSRGRFKGHLNYWDFDLFAAAGAFAVVKGRLVCWASICDSAVAHFKRDGQLKFVSPDGWGQASNIRPAGWDRLPETERKKLGREVYRNGVDKRGRLIGYGVVTGEQAAEKYLNTGEFLAEPGDMVMIFTDGFENYLKLKKFARLFLMWPKNLKSRFKKFTRHCAVNDPAAFGRERTLIVIKF